VAAKGASEVPCCGPFSRAKVQDAHARAEAQPEAGYPARPQRCSHESGSTP
jgi:hypothetical protein